MTTDQHKWLATSFFPEYLIKEVMDAQVDITDIGHTTAANYTKELARHIKITNYNNINKIFQILY